MTNTLAYFAHSSDICRMLGAQLWQSLAPPENIILLKFARDKRSSLFHHLFNQQYFSGMASNVGFRVLHPGRLWPNHQMLDQAREGCEDKHTSLISSIVCIKLCQALPYLQILDQNGLLSTNTPVYLTIFQICRTSCASLGQALALTSNVRTGRKGLRGTNTLAYLSLQKCQKGLLF